MDQCRHDDAIRSLSDAVIVMRERLAGDDKDRKHTNETVDIIKNALTDLAEKMDCHAKNSYENKIALEKMIREQISAKKWFDFKALIGTAGVVCSALMFVSNYWLTSSISPLTRDLNNISCLVVKKYPDYINIISCKKD